MRGSRPGKAQPLSEYDPPRVCAVHHLPLEVGVAPLLYGLVRRRPDDDEHARANFPEAHSVILAGCILEPETESAVRFCPECRRAERAHVEARERDRT